MDLFEGAAQFLTVHQTGRDTSNESSPQEKRKTVRDGRHTRFSKTGNERHQAPAGTGSGPTSDSSSAVSSPSHLATTPAAIELPTALVAERPISRNWSTPIIRSNPASGILKVVRVA